MRRRYRRRQQRPLLFGIAGAFALSLTATMTFAGMNGVDFADAAISKGKSLIELMNQRSPGQRTAAQLTKTKGKHKYYRVLAERSPEMPAPEAYQPLVDVFAPPPETLYAAWPNLPGIFAPTNPLVPPGLIFPCCAIFIPPTHPNPPPIGPVPEPQTWAMMVLGFGALGWQLRRRRNLQVRVARP